MRAVSFAFWGSIAAALSALAWGTFVAGCGAETSGTPAGGGANGSGGEEHGAGSGGKAASGGAGPGNTGGAIAAGGGRGGSPGANTGGAAGRAAGSGGAGNGAGTTGGSTGTGGAGSGGRQGIGGSGPLPAGVTALFPPPGSQGICPDPPLRLTFSGPPALGTAGRIQVFNVASPATAVATVDMAVAMATDTIGGTVFNVPRPVFVDGNAAVVYLRQHALAYGQTYYVTVDGGAIQPPGGGTFTVAGATAWRFTTAAAAPASLASIGVALDGSASFCSVQGALDALPARNTTPALINIARGTFHEIIRFTTKNNVTLRGADRKATIIAATNNNNINAGTAIRSLVGVDSSSGLIIENLTIDNLTPQGGSQAEALRLQSCDQCVVRNADILSLQDTLLFAGRIYVDNCLVAGNVDFVWGGGVAYFNNCEIRTVTRSGVNVQARNAAGAYGYVFVDSRLTSDAGLTNNALARVDVGVYPGSHVAYVNCTLGPHIAPAGWTITAGTPTSALRFWEYQSRDPAGNLIDVSRRVAGVQITAAQAAMMRTPAVVLGGWNPPVN